MEYVTSKEIAKKWGISVRRVNTLCNSGRVPGAYKNGMIWLIPKNAKKPEDKRKSTYKINSNKIYKFYEEQRNYESKLEKDYKKENGVYYTPPELVELMYSDINISRNSVILDPCCGMGAFLIGALKRGFSNIYGIDIDKRAIERVSQYVKSGNVISYDSINNPSNKTLSLLGIRKPDLIIGNPPYVTKKSIFGNLFIGSLIRSLDMVNDNGHISFIIPKNFLHVSTYKDLRKYLLRSYRIISIVDIGSYFKNVRGEQIVITIKNSSPSKSHHISMKILQDGKFVEKMKVKQNIFNNVIRIFLSSEEIDVYKKLSSSYKTLEDYCQGYIGRGRSKSKYAISGKDIKKFGFKNHPVPNEGNKIFVQNIYSSESGIIATYAGSLDAKETVTVITDSDPNTCKFLVGILHSRLINFYLFKYCFNGSKLTAHTDKKYLSQIPIVTPNEHHFKKIIDLVETLQETKYLSKEWFNYFEELNLLVYKIYGLNRDERKFIESYMEKIQSSRWKNK